MIEKSLKELNGPLSNLKKITENLTSDQAQNLMINTQWNLNETIAHLIGWANQFKNEIKFLLEAGDDPFPWHISAKNNWKAFNDKNVKTYHRTALNELIDSLEQINNDIETMLVQNKDSEQLLIRHEIKYYGRFSPVNVLQMIKFKNHHELEHLKQIEEKVLAAKAAQ
jgi:hypothetical protein